jgi:hypothetical protein
MDLAAAQALLCAAGVILKAIPYWQQVNADLIALALPPHLALAWAMYHLWRHPPPLRQPAGKGAPRPDASARRRSARRR